MASGIFFSFLKGFVNERKMLQFQRFPLRVINRLHWLVSVLVKGWGGTPPTPLRS